MGKSEIRIKSAWKTCTCCPRNGRAERHGEKKQGTGTSGARGMSLLNMDQDQELH